jgi:hypothetical protein
MTIQQFIELDLNERVQMLWDQGTYLETAFQNGYMINLHSFQAFFVEVHYHTDSQRIEKAEIANEDDMRKYLGRIDIGS